MKGLFSDNPEGLRQLIENLCQQILQEEIAKYLQAEWHERTSGRKGQRNGYKKRSIKTRVGEIHEDWISGRRYLRMDENIQKEDADEEIIEFPISAEVVLN